MCTLVLAWTLIGPTSVAGSGVTQMITEVVQDNTGVNKSVFKAVTNDTVVGVVSKQHSLQSTQKLMRRHL